jgi:hypothetical protein
MKKIKNLKSKACQAGFTGIEILIALGIIAGLSTVLINVFKKEVEEAPILQPEKESKAVEPTPPTIKSPFPAAVKEKTVVDPPAEPVITPYDQGKPIPKPTATGEWHGRFDVTAPDKCKGESGGWEANLSEANGVISGNFTTDVGISGKVKGTVSGDKAEWSIGDADSVISFKGSISGGTMSGNFTGTQCSKESPDKSTGSFFGGRTVKSN